MARLEFKLPDIGEGIAEAEVVEWHAAVGEAVAEGQVVASVMTDKATVEIEAPADGRIVERGAQAGAMLPIGAVLFVMETAGEDAPAEDVAAPADPAAGSGPAVAAPEMPSAAQPEPAAPAVEPAPATEGVAP